MTQTPTRPQRQAGKATGAWADGDRTPLNPERVVLLPDGVEDLWNQSYADLISLA